MNHGDELKSLREEIISCKSCNIYNYWKKPVAFDIGKKTDILIIGRDPGADEVQQGLPFVGKSGQKLNCILFDAGLHRMDLAVFNIGCCRKANNLAYTFEEYKYCGDLHLKKLIEIIKPKIIVSLGKEALEYLMNHKIPDTMTYLRGKERKYNGISVIPEFHPSYLIKLQRMEPEKYTTIYNATVEDFKRVKERLGY